MSLKFKIIGYALGMLLTFGGITLFQYHTSGIKNKAAMSEQVETFALGLSNSIVAQFYERYGDVQAFAKNYAFATGDVKAINAALNEYTKLYGIYDLILFVDIDGDYVTSNTVTPDGKPLSTAKLKSKNFSNETWFKNAVQEKYTEEPKKNLVGTFVGAPEKDALVSEMYGEERYTNIFSTAVKDSKGNIVGVLTNKANFKWVEFEIVTLFHSLEHKGFATASIDIIDTNGIVISHYSPGENGGNKNVKRDFSVLGNLNLHSKNLEVFKELEREPDGFLEETHYSTNEKVVTGYAKLEGDKWVDSIGWTSLIHIPSKELNAEIIAAENFFIACLAAMIVAFSVFLFWVLNKLTQQLTDLIQQLNSAGKEVQAASSQQGAASQQVSNGSTQSASALEETVSSIEELSSMVKLNADHAKEASHLSNASRESAETGEREIRSLIESMSEISKSSKRIEEIINVIDDIAFQTNLLALNAAVEAARAGEQGKGFAVVAEAVRNLAQRSAAAAKDINTLIKESVEKISNGSKIADASGEVLKNIVASVKKVADLNQEISSASQEQANGIGQISKAMNELDSSTQQNAASAEEMAAAAEELSAQSEQLRDLVNRFSNIVEGTRGKNVTTGPNHNTLKNNTPQPHTRFEPQVVASKNETNASNVIPFDDGNDNSYGKVGNTKGF